MSKQIRDAVEILYRTDIKGDPERLASLDAERIKSVIAQHLYDWREEAGLTHKELARKIGTPENIIGGIETTDYEDDELYKAFVTLHQVAKAVGKRVKLDVQIVTNQ